MFDLGLYLRKKLIAFENDVRQCKDTVQKEALILSYSRRIESDIKQWKGTASMKKPSKSALDRIRLLRAIRDNEPYSKANGPLATLCQQGCVDIHHNSPDSYGISHATITPAGESTLSFYEKEWAEYL